VSRSGGWRLPEGLRAFRHRPFRLFWTGQLVSLVGTWMQQVAQGWLVLQLTGDPVALGVVAAAQYLPVLVLGLFGGVVADAVPKRTALLLTQSASGILALILGLLVVTDTVQVWHVVVLAALLGTVNAFDMPIRQAFAIEMVGRADVTSAVALNSALFNGARIAGPAAAGLLISSVGLAPCFLLNAVSYVAVVAGLLRIDPAELRTPDRGPAARSRSDVGGQLLEGLSYVRASRPILLAVSMVGVVSTAALNFQVLMPLAARDLLGGGADTFGFLMAASGLGSLASALHLAFGGPPSTTRLLTGAAAVGAATTTLAFSASLPISLGLMFVAGWGLIALAATTNMLIQLGTPDALRGRVMSVYTTVFAGSTPIGGLAAGAVAASAGVAVALALGGLVALAAVGVGAVAAARVSPRAHPMDGSADAPSTTPLSAWWRRRSG
jgi:MFS family permease